MADGLQPFIPIYGSVSTAGPTIGVAAISTSSIPGTFTVKDAYTLLVTNSSTTVQVFVRMSTEAVPVCTSADVPLPFNSSRIFEVPNPVGANGIAAYAPNGATVVYFTPGNGGNH